MIYKSERAKENTSNPTGKLDDQMVPQKLITRWGTCARASIGFGSHLWWISNRR
jgi:hypothetical protein